MRARRGKIARLPAKLKDALNLRLLDNQPASVILAWLNGQEDTRRVLDQYFEGSRISPQNLTEWRHGGFQDWMRKKDQAEATREMATWCMEMAQAAGHSLTDGAAAIMGGKLLNLLEGVSTDELDPQTFEVLTVGLERLRKGDHRSARLQQLNLRLDQMADAIALEKEKFELQLKKYKDQVRQQKAVIEGELQQARKGGLTPEALERIEEAAKLL